MKKIALVGFGFMGQTHGGNILETPGLELTCVIDRIPKALLRPAAGNLKTRKIPWETLKDIPFYDTLDAACEKHPDLDAAIIAAPNAMHAELVESCLRHHLHVFVEKPFCVTVQDLAKLRQALAVSDRIVQVGHCVRFLKQYRYLAEQLKSGACGALHYLKFYRWTGMPAWGDWKNAAMKAGSGGALFDLNIHDIDFALSILGDPQHLTVNPVLQARFGNMVFDSTWTYDQGPIVHLEGGFLPPSNLPFRCGYCAVFEKATLEFSSSAGDFVARSEGQYSERVDCSEENDPYLAEMHDFARCLENGCRPQCDAAAAAHAVEFCQRLQQ